MASHEYNPRLPDRKADGSMAWEAQNLSMKLALIDIMDRLQDPEPTHNARVTRSNNCLTATYGNIANSETACEYSLAIRVRDDGDKSLEFAASEIVSAESDDFYVYTRSYIVFWDNAVDWKVRGNIIPSDSSFEIFCSMQPSSDLPPSESPPTFEKGEDSWVLSERYWGYVDDFHNFTVMRSEQMLEDLESFKIVAGLN